MNTENKDFAVSMDLIAEKFAPLTGQPLELAMEHESSRVRVAEAQASEEASTQDNSVVELTLEFVVKVNTNGVSVDYLKERLHDVVMHAIEEGDITGSTDAELADYTITVTETESD